MYELRTRGNTNNLVASEEFLNRVYFESVEFWMSDEELFNLIRYNVNAELERNEQYEVMAHPFDLDDNPFPLTVYDGSKKPTYASDNELLESYRCLNLVVVDRRRGHFSIPPQKEVW